jgi:hypothetical protein
LACVEGHLNVGYNKRMSHMSRGLLYPRVYLR